MNVSARKTNDAATIANDAHASNRVSILQAINLADDNLTGAMLLGLKMTVEYGPTSKDEVTANYPRCNNPSVYASWFNLGDKAQAIVGQKLALEAISRAASEGKGAGFNKAKDALGAIIKDAKSQGLKELKPAAAKLAVKSAVLSATAPKPKTEKSATPARGTKTPDSATLAAAAIESGKSHQEMARFVRLASQNAHRMPAPVGREEAHTMALKTLADAAEAWAVFIR